MEKRNTILGSILLAAVMLAAPLNVKAADAKTSLTFEGDSGKFITYQQDSAYEDLAPGEERVQSITLTNEDYREMKFYVRSDLGLINEEATSQNIAYDIKFSQDGEVFYSGQVGGVTQANMDSLENNYLLKTLKQGESTTIDMAIGFDGDSMDNSYQGAQGSLNLVFSVEYEENTPVEKVVNIVKKVPIINQIEAVKTGDSASVGLFLGAFMAAVVAVIVVLAAKRKRKKEGA